MAAPTKEEVQDFINKNISFFITPLSEEGQKKFQQFYKDANAMNQISDYSQKLMALLHKCTQKLSSESVTPVIYAWRKGDFAPALEHEEVRQFIMDNQDHPAVVMWRNNKSTIELNKSETKTPRQEPPVPIEDKTNKLGDFTEKFMKMDKNEFEYLFSGSDTQVRSGNIFMNRRLSRAGLTGELFKTQEDYNNWMTNLISARNPQTPTQAQETSTRAQETPTQVQETPVPAQRIPKGLDDFTEKFMKMDKGEFDYCFSSSDSQKLSGDILMNRRLWREGLTGKLFKSQEDYDSWKSNLISARNPKTPTQAQETSTRVQETPTRAQETPTRAQETPRRAQETPRRAQETPKRAQETPKRAQEKPKPAQKGLIDNFINAIKNLCHVITDFCNSCLYSNNYDKRNKR
ncbi:TPA: hypothetical protein F8R96_13385 [Legionella pneumophila]|nr:hypothetical protein [Legionella pneumophila]HBI2947551.1 hypothetical protein [Legionella pneumophila]